MKKLLQGKTILITGGTGFLGIALTREIIKQNPLSIRLFSRDEVKHHRIQEFRAVFQKGQEDFVLIRSLPAQPFAFTPVTSVLLSGRNVTPMIRCAASIIGLRRETITNWDWGDSSVIMEAIRSALEPSSDMSTSSNA